MKIVGDLHANYQGFKNLIDRYPKDLLFLGDIFNSKDSPGSVENTASLVNELQSLENSGRAEIILSNHDYCVGKYALFKVEPRFKVPGWEVTKEFVNSTNKEKLAEWIFSHKVFTWVRDTYISHAFPGEFKNQYINPNKPILRSTLKTIGVRSTRFWWKNESFDFPVVVGHHGLVTNHLNKVWVGDLNGRQIIVFDSQDKKFEIID